MATILVIITKIIITIDIKEILNYDFWVFYKKNKISQNRRGTVEEYSSSKKDFFE